jgi:hypothetical protein
MWSYPEHKCEMSVYPVTVCSVYSYNWSQSCHSYYLITLSSYPANKIRCFYF